MVQKTIKNKINIDYYQTLACKGIKVIFLKKQHNSISLSVTNFNSFLIKILFCFVHNNNNNIYQKCLFKKPTFNFHSNLCSINLFIFVIFPKIQLKKLRKSVL